MFHSYPACCVLKCSPLVYPERDTHLITAAFISDIHSRMPSICGQKVTFSTTSFHTTSELNPASSSSLIPSSGHANLSFTPPAAKTHPHRPLGNCRGSIGFEKPSGKENHEVLQKRSAGESVEVPSAKRCCLDSSGNSSGASDTMTGGLVPQLVPDLNQPIQNFLSPQCDATAAEGASEACYKGVLSTQQPHKPSYIDNIARQSLLSLVPKSLRATVFGPPSPVTQQTANQNPEIATKKVCLTLHVCCRG